MSERDEEEWNEFLRWRREQGRTGGPEGVESEPSVEPPPTPDQASLPVDFAPPQSPSFPPAEADSTQATPDESWSAQPNERRNWVAPLVAGLAVALLIAGGAGVWMRNAQAADAEAVHRVEESIAAIGEVSIESEAAVVDAEEAFDALEPGLAAEVGNADVLIEARSMVDSELAEVATVQEAIDRASEVLNCSNAVYADGKYDRLSDAQQLRIVEAEDVLAAARKCELEEDRAEAAEATAEWRRKSNLVRIEGPWWEEGQAASSDGCEYWVTPKFTNLSESTFNYVWFDVSFVNQVEDVEVDVDGNESHNLRVVGPISAGDTYEDEEYGFALNYSCGDVAALQLNSVTVQYEDGGQDTLDWRYLKCSESWNDSCSD